MVNGFIDRLFYGRGLVNRDLPFAELKARATINEKALAADTDPDFSRRIREGLPPRRRWVSSRRPQDAPGRPALRQETGSDPKDCSIEQIRGGVAGGVVEADVEIPGPPLDIPVGETAAPACAHREPGAPVHIPLKGADGVVAPGVGRHDHLAQSAVVVVLRHRKFRFQYLWRSTGSASIFS